ncbi:MAG: peptidyl-prolyl cis-trans isomerase [Nanoarchaeota archaeon]|nr:peptidyl-prolyl cis-trans isomerase [Nanoarchaeota archaeon]
MVSKVNASHILMKTEGECYMALKALREGKSFEEVAKEKSLCPSKRKGGSLGWFGRGMMVKEFEEACFNSKKGQIMGPVKTQFGYHIIRIDDTQ